ncbi:MAG: aminoglycoside phosphotransferase family protein [Anaerolineales bacterium]
MFNQLPIKLSPDQILTLCQRGFGKGIKIKSIREIGGGTFNETYLIKFSGKAKTILRVAPAPSPDLFWDDFALMRREHTMLPYFAVLSPLIPRVLLTDFTHQLIGRDYMFQSVLEGERWSEIEKELTPEENLTLWRQCGALVKKLHMTTGEWFGYPYPGFHNRWQDVILERFSRISQSMDAHQINIPAFESIFKLVRTHTAIFDEIVLPRLLHGDLWTFNLLVIRGEEGPIISGILDTDRAWWGDPLADWIMFLFSIRQDAPEWQARITAFEEGYGSPELGPTSAEAVAFRKNVYKAMHIGLAALWSFKHKNEEDLARASEEISLLAQTLEKLA